MAEELHPRFASFEYSQRDDKSQASTDNDTEMGRAMECDNDPDHRSQFWQTVQYSFSGHAVVIVVLGALWSVLVHSYAPEYDYGVALISSPAREAVSYERVMMDTNIYEKSDFIGQPRPELDAAWDGLLKSLSKQDQYQAVRPSQLAEEQSVTLNDVTGRVLIQLEAYHTLNCLNFVRKFAFRTYYNMTDDPANIQHFGECLERVRQTTMCYGDISART
ncbi:hypothetical protein LQW54_000400 [Pestalotiopsis sp. IQ-011]